MSMPAVPDRSVVVDTSRSAHARLRPVAIGDVTIDDAFWSPRRRQNRETTLPSQYRQLWETGRFNNLLRVSGRHDGPFEGRYFNDSDVYKWLEAAAWSLAEDRDPALEAMVDEAIGVLASAQGEDGYLNSYYALERASERFTDADYHELYCAGHLFQAAVAHHRATGRDHLLDVARRFAGYLAATIGPPEEGKRLWTDGHPEVELALVELSRETGERRYLDLARFLLDVRGHGFLGDAYNRFGRQYHQDHQPFRELDEIVGHAVRAVYLNAGAADLWAETGDPALGQALRRLWENMTSCKMYVSGGLGSRYEGEAFGENYELPNRLAYTETCAAIGSVMWAWRMLLVEADARYADVMELQLYNAMLAGVSLDGEHYFYQNPLADEGHHRRAPWFRTACCPPNVARTLAALPGHLYAVSDHAVWIHFFAESQARLTLPDGTAIGVRQTTRYPWDGVIDIEIDAQGAFALHARVPGWCADASVSVNDAPIETPLTPGSYLTISRRWRPGDRVRLTLPMPVRLVEGHPFVSENSGGVALFRGPLLYCFEATDNRDVDLRSLALQSGHEFHAVARTDLLGGVTALTGPALVAGPGEGWDGRLYRPASAAPVTGGQPVTVTAIPYYAWANREAGRMRVWLPAPPAG